MPQPRYVAEFRESADRAVNAADKLFNGPADLFGFRMARQGEVQRLEDARVARLKLFVWCKR